MRRDGHDTSANGIARLRREFAGTRRCLRRAVAGRSIARASLVAGIILLAASAATRVLPSDGLARVGVAASAIAFLVVSVLGMRRRIGDQEAALWLDRVLDGEETFVAALELAAVPDESGRAALTVRRAERILSDAGEARCHPHVRAEWFVPGLLSLVGATAIFLLPHALPRGGDDDSAVTIARLDGASPGTDEVAGPEGAASDGDSRAEPVLPVSRPMGNPEEAPGQDRSAPGTREAGAAANDRPEGAEPGVDDANESTPADFSASREVVRRLSKGIAGDREREALLRALEEPGGESGSGAGARGPSGKSGTSGEGAPEGEDEGSRAGGDARHGSRALPGRYPRRYRELVARYFDPTL